MDTRHEETGSRNNRNRDDDFATHYYGNEKDLRERDRIARAESHGDDRDSSSKHFQSERKNIGSQSDRSDSSSKSRSERRDFSSGRDNDRDFERESARRNKFESSSDRTDRSSRESDVGREPYRPERHYHRASEDSRYESSGDRKNWKQMYNEFFTDFSHLLKKESQLIRTELSEKASDVKQGAVSVTTGAIVAFVGIQALAATVVIALGYVMAWWLAALVTGVAFLLIGMGLMAAAKKKFSGDNLTPYRSIESFDHMGSMLKEKKDEFTRH